MAGTGDDRRRWPRLVVGGDGEVASDGNRYPCAVNDLSAGGASVAAKDLEGLDDEGLALALEGFGEYGATVVRRWDDGVALEFDIAEDDRYSLQEELESFRRENEMEWY